MLKNFDKNQNYYKFYKRKNIPIVFIHGVGLDHEMWFPQIRSFKYNSILVYDLLGHGKTPLRKKTVKFDLSNANKVSVDIYVPSSSITGSQDNKLWLKLQNGNKDRPWEGQITAEQAVELDKWQRLTFDFSDQSSATEFTRMLVQFNGENNYDSVMAYIDNVFIHR